MNESTEGEKTKRSDKRDSEDKEDTSNRSKKTIRTPIKSQQKREDKLDKILIMLQQLTLEQKAMSKRERKEVERDMFGKGKKVIKSPEQNKREERTKDGDRSIKKTAERESQEMEEMKGLIKEVMKKMDDNMDEIKQEIKLVRKEMEEKKGA
ncbi:hypothetical protein FQA39_LY00268 [Lamprigera yunnana]|nr:hypothetical protein FQA39_LY00268 [Lamprigera yunnana]